MSYIPEGFVLFDKTESKTYIRYSYSNGDEYINISKNGTVAGIYTINTEHADKEIVVIDNVEYIAYGEEKYGGGVLWSKNDYIYNLSSKLPKEEMLKIAVSAD